MVIPHPAHEQERDHTRKAGWGKSSTLAMNPMDGCSIRVLNI